jgi:ABC-type Fe3+ transport system permease subunit
LEKEEQQRGWWRTLWIWAFMGNIVLTAFLPVGLFPLYAAIAVRVWWKWREKRRQKRAPGQTAQQVPRAAAPSAASEVTKSDTSS